MCLKGEGDKTKKPKSARRDERVHFFAIPLPKIKSTICKTQYISCGMSDGQNDRSLFSVGFSIFFLATCLEKMVEYKDSMQLKKQMVSLKTKKNKYSVNYLSFLDILRIFITTKSR